MYPTLTPFNRVVSLELYRDSKKLVLRWQTFLLVHQVYYGAAEILDTTVISSSLILWGTKTRCSLTGGYENRYICVLLGKPTLVFNTVAKYLRTELSQLILINTGKSKMVDLVSVRSNFYEKRAVEMVLAVTCSTTKFPHVRHKVLRKIGACVFRKTLCVDEHVTANPTSVSDFS
jgi:hypothetical protein